MLDVFYYFSWFCLTTIQNYDIKLFLFTELQDNCNSTWQNLPTLLEDDFEQGDRERESKMEVYRDTLYLKPHAN